MEDLALLELGFIVILGIGSQWIAWRLKIPSIILLLLSGFLAGSIFHFIHPDQLLGNLLLPLVSISVAIILFEGGLSLRLRELREIGPNVLSLVTIGAFLTWILVTLSAYYILQLQFKISVLIGSILVVTGPTVISPLLHHIKPSARVAEILKWEGIVIDPIGALLAVLVFEVIELGSFELATRTVLFSLLKTVAVSILLSIVFTWILYFFLKKYWIPEFLEESVTLSNVIAAFVLSNIIQPESGLFTVTFMGILLGNQKKISIRNIIEFKENLVVIIISILFVILAARFQLKDFQFIHANFIIFSILLLIAIRPLSVFLSTIFSKIPLKEKIFISWMAPRGIVAAAISSIFAFKLQELNVPQTEYIVPVVFGVIVVTVIVYGLTSPLLAQALHLSQANPQGVLIVGAHDFAIHVAKILQNNNFKSILVDTNPQHVFKAKMEGLKSYQGNILSDKLVEHLDLSGIGKLLAMTPNDEANSLAVLHMDEFFEKQHLFQLYPFKEKEKIEEVESLSKALQGRYLFGENITYDVLIHRMEQGYVVKITTLSEDYTLEEFNKNYPEAIILFKITPDKLLFPQTADTPLQFAPGDKVIALVKEKQDNTVKSAN